MKSNHIDARIQEGLEQAQRGEFVTDEEMEAFFVQHAVPMLSDRRVL